MELNVEFKIFDMGYDIEKIYPTLMSITFRLRQKLNTIMRLNFNPHEVNYLIRKVGDYIFIEAAGETFKHPLGFGQYYADDLGDFMNYIFNDDIDIVNIGIDFGVDVMDSIISVENLSITYPDWSSRNYFSKSVLDKYNIKLSARNKEEL